MRMRKMLRSRRLVIPAAAAAVLSAGILLSVVISGAGTPKSAYGQATSQQQRPALDGKSALLGLQNAFRDVAQKVLPVVVEIDVVDVVKQQVPTFESPFEYFFGPQDGQGEKPKEREFRAFGLGSGVIIRKAGNTIYVLTNNHVAGEADEINVKLNNRKQYKAKLVGKDTRKDLALVSFETSDPVTVAELGDSEKVQVGDIVFAVGNPLGFDSSITSGIVSALGRKTPSGSGVAGFTEYIQTDAAINQGNSGGALVDIDGKVIGINTWIASPSGGNIGLGFTIPINNAKKAIDDLITKGKVEYGWLGVNIGELTPEARKELKVGEAAGAFIHNVYKGSPADKGGIIPGDYVTGINGLRIEDTNQLVTTVAGLPLDRNAEFELIREGRSVKVAVNIATRKDEGEIEKQAENLWPGMSVLPLTEDIQNQLGLPKRSGDLVVAQVQKGSPADLAGLKPGDVITAVNGKKVDSLVEFYRAMNAGKEPAFRIERQGRSLIIGLVK